jgi:hypothetical protein
LPTSAADNWDIARLPPSEGRSGQAAWAETFAARALGIALANQPDFWDDVDRIRQGESALAIARRYVRRDQSRRAELISVYLQRAADAAPHPDHRFETAALLAIGQRAWWPDAPLDPGQPQRNLRRDVIETIEMGALRVARRPARRCADPDCGDPHGGALGRYNDDDYCGPCKDAVRQQRVVRQPRETDEAERALFDAAIAAVLKNAPNRPRSRRQRRHRSAA